MFIKEVLDRSLAEMETFVARAELILDMPQSAALLPRLEKLEGFLKVLYSTHDLRPLQQLVTRLRPHQR